MVNTNLMFILFLLSLIIILPLCVGVILALLIRATGWNYYLIVLGVSCLIWLLLKGYYEQ